MGIQVDGVSKRFGEFLALDGIHLEIPSGALTALLGPSGSGKTTLLRIISGLDQADAGQVLLQGEDAASKNPRDRGVGFVFQHYALFPHMTVFENVAFGLRVMKRRRRPAKKEIRDRVFKLLSLVQLERLSERYPAQLSGGQRQRVALARALAVEPKVLLLDEPFGALDAKVRKELRRWLRRLHDEIHVTSVFVTHDQEEALEVADQVVVMNAGRIEQVGSPEEVYHHPANPFVYNFLGDVNLFHGRMEEGRIELGATPAPDAGPDQEGATQLFVRPHLLEISLDQGEGIAGRVRHVNPAGPFVKVEVETEAGAVMHANISQERYRDLGLVSGMPVFVIPKEARVFKEEGIL